MNSSSNVNEDENLQQQLCKQLVQGGEQLDPIERRRLLRELLALNYDWILRMCLYEISDRESALECLQEIMVASTKGLARYNGRAQFRTWLFTVAKRSLWRFRKNERKTRQRQALSSGFEVEELPLGEGHGLVVSAEQALIFSESQGQLIAAVRGLADQQRSAVLLYYFEELPVSQVAEHLGCSVGAVKTHLFRARKILRRVLSQEQTEQALAEKSQ